MSKWMPLSNKECMTQPTLINLHPTEYSQNINANVNISLMLENVTWNKIEILISLSIKKSKETSVLKGLLLESCKM